jgi:Ca2+-binding RTX toxin-like protein
MTFGDFDLSVTSGPKKLGANVIVSIENTLSDVVMGDINLSGGVRGATDVTMTYTADVNAYAAGNLTVGNITVSGGDGLSDNFESLDFAVPTWLDVSAGGNVVVGAIDYSGYGAAVAIDVSTVGGAPSIAGGAKADTITDNKGANAITGNGGADIFKFIDANTGKTVATFDQILDFTNSAGDKIDITPVVNVANYSEGVYADFATYAAAANAGNKAVFVGEVGGVDGVIAAVDYDVNGSVDFMINLVGVGLDGVDVASFV